MSSSSPTQSGSVRFISRNRGEILDVMRLSIPGPRNSPYGKLDYLLGRVPNQDSKGKGGLFAEVLGFIDETLDSALRSHLINNFGEATIEEARIIVTGMMIGPNGHTADIISVWQVMLEGFINLITAYRNKKDR